MKEVISGKILLREPKDGFLTIGDVLPKSDYVVTRIIPKTSKDIYGAPRDVSVIGLYSPRMKKELLITLGQVQLGEPVARMDQVKEGSEFTAKIGDTFTLTWASQPSYTVSDIRVGQVILTEISTGKAFDIPIHDPPDLTQKSGRFENVVLLVSKKR